MIASHRRFASLAAGLFMGGRLVVALAKHRQNQKELHKTQVVAGTQHPAPTPSNSGGTSEAAPSP